MGGEGLVHSGLPRSAGQLLLLVGQVRQRGGMRGGWVRAVMGERGWEGFVGEGPGKARRARGEERHQ